MPISKKILIIDDDPDLVRFIRCILEDYGYHSVGCLSSTASVDTARYEKPDLILLDLFMPVKGGISVFRELKADPELQYIPVIILSGMAQVTGVDVSTFIGRQIDLSGNDLKGRSTTLEGLVDKPIEPDKLIRTIKKNMNQGDM